MLRVFWVVLRLIYVPDVWFSVPWDGQDRPKRQDEYRCDFRPAPHDLNHLEPCKGDAAVTGILGCSWALMGAPKAQNAWFRVARNKWDRGGCRYDFNPMQPSRLIQKKCGSVWGLFHCFQALMRALGAPHVWFRVSWDVWDMILNRGGFRHDIWVLQHHFRFLMVVIIWIFFMFISMIRNLQIDKWFCGLRSLWLVALALDFQGSCFWRAWSTNGAKKG